MQPASLLGVRQLPLELIEVSSSWQASRLYLPFILRGGGDFFRLYFSKSPRYILWALSKIRADKQLQITVPTDSRKCEHVHTPGHQG
jgi:hypothetical protein